MKTNRILTGLLLATVAMGGLTGCSSDEPLVKPVPGQEEVEDGEGIYMGLTIKMPSGGTRSETTEEGGSTGGVEVGTDAENKVSSVYVVLAKASDNSFIASAKVEGTDNLTPIPSANSYKATAKIQKTNLNDYYVAPGFSPNINVFVFCNPTVDLENLLKNAEVGKTDWLQGTCTVIQGELGTPDQNIQIWQPNQFLMNNARIARRSLPRTISEWDSYKTAATAFDLSGLNAGGQENEVDNSSANDRGAVLVERSVARFDFKDSSPSTTPAYTYNVVNVNKEAADGSVTSVPLIQVQLNRIMLANMAKKFYYLPRVSANGLNVASTLCGAETPTNYVVGPYATEFRNDITSGFSNYFNYTFFDDAAGSDGTVGYDGQTWANTLLSSLTTDDNYDYGTTNPERYKVWRYCTENVIPYEPSNQLKGITTTVIFKGRFLAAPEANAEGQDQYTKDMYKYLNNIGGILKGDAINDPTLYSFKNTLYFTWENVFHAAILASVRMDESGNVKLTEDGQIEYINRTDPLYVAVFGGGGIGKFTWGTGPDGKPLEYDDTAVPVNENSANVAAQAYNAEGGRTPANLIKMRKAVVGAGFTIYQSSTDADGTKGYYCYYYYYNRHNDNGNNGSMGPMEFCVVRNNVYKLAVSDIMALGHPRLPENDPDAPKPDDPDESDNVYLTVTCDVIPWVVRFNNIEFH